MRTASTHSTGEANERAQQAKPGEGNGKPPLSTCQENCHETLLFLFLFYSYFYADISYLALLLPPVHPNLFPLPHLIQVHPQILLIKRKEYINWSCNLITEHLWCHWNNAKYHSIIIKCNIKTTTYSCHNLLFCHSSSSFIQANYIAPPQVHYYSEVLLTQHGYCVGVSHQSATGATASEGLPQGPYVAARAGFEPTTFGRKATNLPMSHHTPLLLHYHPLPIDTRNNV